MQREGTQVKKGPEDEKKARLAELKEKIKNPLFRMANEQLVKKLEREIVEQEAEDRIRTYLRDENPGASFAQVVLDTKVEIKILEQLIADGRIEIKITEKDWNELEEEQKKLINSLTKTSKILKEKGERNRQEQDENAIKMSGMYSKSFGKEQKKPTDI